MLTMTGRMPLLLVVGDGHLCKPQPEDHTSVVFEVSSLRVCPCCIDKYFVERTSNLPVSWRFVELTVGLQFPRIVRVVWV